MKTSNFRSFKEFYLFYLSQHSLASCRALHYLGSVGVIALTAFAVTRSEYMWLVLLPVVGYGAAWTGHFFIEKNKPATFKYPWYSLLADWVMLKDAILSVFGIDNELQRFVKEKAS